MAIGIIARTAVMLAAVASIPNRFPGVIAAQPLAMANRTSGMTGATASTATVATPITAAVATAVAATITAAIATACSLGRGDER